MVARKIGKIGGGGKEKKIGIPVHYEAASD